MTPELTAASTNSANGSGQVSGYSTSTLSFTVFGCSSALASARPVISNVRPLTQDSPNGNPSRAVRHG